MRGLGLQEEQEQGEKQGIWNLVGNDEEAKLEQSLPSRKKEGLR